MVGPASVSRRHERPSRIAVSRRSGKSRPPQSAAWLHGRVVSRSASPPPGRTDEPGQLILSLPVWPGAPCVCWPTRRCCRVGRRPVGANGPNFCGTLGRCRRRPESGDPSENPWSVWRLGSCGTWHLPAAAVALRCQVAHSPDRKPARPLPRLGGVEPQTAGQRPLLALTAQRPRWTLLCCVKGWVGLEEAVELAGDVADQAAFDLAVGLALGASSLGVGAGCWVGA
jgi:hypothetical protein